MKMREVLAVIAISAAYALGTIDTAIQPMWIPEFVRDGTLSRSETGWVGSIELFLIGCSTLAVSLVGRRVNIRYTAIAAAVLIAIANLAAMSSHVAVLIGGRAVSGLATGALIACIIFYAAGSGHAQRMFAWMQTAILVCVISLYFFAPGLIAQHGARALFAIVSGGAVLVGCLLAVGLPAAPGQFAQSEAPPQGGARERFSWPPVFACLAWIMVMIGISTINSYVFVIGERLNFSMQTVANVAAVSYTCALLGPLAARVLGERFGLLWPMLIGFSIVAAGFFVTVNAPTPFIMGAAGALQAMSAQLAITYMMAFITSLDRSGRVASASPAFGMLGAAVGPKLGGELIALQSRQPLAIVASISVLIGLMLFVIAGRLEARKQPDPSDTRDAVVTG